MSSLLDFDGLDNHFCNFLISRASISYSSLKMVSLLNSPKLSIVSCLLGNLGSRVGG